MRVLTIEFWIDEPWTKSMWNDDWKDVVSRDDPKTQAGYLRLQELLRRKYWENMDRLALLATFHIGLGLASILWLNDGCSIVQSFSTRVDILLSLYLLVFAMTGYLLKKVPTVTQAEIQNTYGVVLPVAKLKMVQRAVGPDFSKAPLIGVISAGVTLALTVLKNTF